MTYHGVSESTMTCIIDSEPGPVPLTLWWIIRKIISTSYANIEMKQIESASSCRLNAKTVLCYSVYDE